MQISFFSPIFSDKPHPLEKFSFLRTTTHFFDFGQKGYTIRYYDHNGKLELLEKEGENATWISILLRVAALATVIIPLVMLIGAWIYRLANEFHASHSTNQLNDLPPEILGKIFKMTGPSILQVCSTSKANQHIIEAKLPLQKNGEIVECNNPLSDFQILLRCLEDWKNVWLQLGYSYDGDIGKLPILLAPLDPKKALEMVNLFSDFHQHRILTAIAHSLTLSDPEKAMNLIDRVIVMRDVSSSTYANLVQILTSLDLGKARKLVEQIPDGFNKIKALISIAKATAVSDPENAKNLIEQAIAVAQLFENASREAIGARAVIIEACALLNPEKGLELLDEAFQMESSYSASKALAALSRSALLLKESSKAAAILEVAFNERIKKNYYFHEIFKEELKVLSLFDALWAGNVANFCIEKVQQLDIGYQCASLADIAFALSLSNPEKAQEVLILAQAAYNSIEKVTDNIEALCSIAVAMHSLNIPGAHEKIDEAILLCNDVGFHQSNIAKALAHLDLKRAMEMVNSIPNRYTISSCLMEICRSKLEPYTLEFDK